MLDSVIQVAIGSDHAGFDLKEEIKKHFSVQGFVFQDYGTFSDASMDYPDAAHPVAKAVEAGEFRWGILLCGSGNGVAMTANKYQGIRAALCWNEEIARLARLHNNANILVLPARFISGEEAMRCVETFSSTGFEGGRHERRVEKISHTL